MTQESPELTERKNKNLLWIGIISIIMLFAGLTSAYLVIKSDNFWVHTTLPSWFIISTVVIILSSISFYMAFRSAKADNKKGIKIFMAITLLLGAGFTFTQFKGWKQLTKQGYFFVGNIKAPGTYGENVIVSKNGVPIDYNFDDGTYSLQGETLKGEALDEFKAFVEAIYNSDRKKKKYDLNGFEGYKVRIFTDSSEKFEPLTFENGTLYSTDPMGNRHQITGRQATLLHQFAENVTNERGYFYMDGEYGKDFTITYQEKTLDYKNGKLYVDGKELSQEEYLQLEDTRNNASSFIYILSFLHLLHLIGGWFYMIGIIRGAVQEKFGASNYLKIKLGSIYWHFLGGLWLYLYLFLTFIH